ncbi:MAG: universal stress protein [Candidatus Hydrogenedentes bacterium]|nr:universal stress protein [Candidatus Hydrogenedentota bacterium]
MYHHILIPLENSAADATILEHIRPLARLTHARITLLHVADGFAARNQPAMGESDEMREDRAYLARRQNELTSEGFAVSAILEYGEPAERILETADKERCDLIAMSTHGHRFLNDLILGSVAATVRHRTHIPVLMLRALEK